MKKTAKFSHLCPGNKLVAVFPPYMGFNNNHLPNTVEVRGRFRAK